MAIAFVNGSTAKAAVTGTTATITYAPIAGNIVTVGIQWAAVATTPSCKDNNGNALASVTSIANMTNFVGTAVSGATAYTVTWATSRLWASALSEYSGVSSVGGNATSTGSTTTGIVSFVSTAPTSWVLGYVGAPASKVFTASIGTIREQTATSASVCIGDNQSVSTGATVTFAVTLALGTWGAIATELIAAPQVLTTHNQLMMVGCGT